MATLLPKRDRERVIALSVLVLCCVGSIGGMFYLQSRAAIPAVIGIRQAPDPQLVAETEARKKEKILRYRDLWQVWAKAHQPQLRAMLHAQPNDLTALHAVVAAIPDRPSKRENGFEFAEFCGIKNLSDPVVDFTSYSHLNLHVVRTTPEDKAWGDKVQRWEELCDRMGFAQLRDVTVVRSTSSESKKSYCLWASGRVTESRYASPDIDKEYVIVTPPYDFLVS